jgi:hypothetical protein
MTLAAIVSSQSQIGSLDFWMVVQDNLPSRLHVLLERTVLLTNELHLWQYPRLTKGRSSEEMFEPFHHRGQTI